MTSNSLRTLRLSFSALQRAEIAEIVGVIVVVAQVARFSALQRAEIAEIGVVVIRDQLQLCARFSALQRAEIAEIFMR